MIQTDFFSTQEFQALNQNVSNYKDSGDRVRRAVFGQVGELKKEFKQELQQQKQEIDQIKFLLAQMQELRELVG